ncbi:hypothetical protein [Acidobacterium sp. S8]|uniref:hypothetical protein n=1 Tax=Acidobacterium sp. S8 TaxID=1641854 RepID=UPI00131D2DA6|nr:hypothetical protein [Acidobacterium sp. S8]
MLVAMQATDPSWSKILTAVLGVLGFVLSCYNYLRQKRKDKEEEQNQLWAVRGEFNERRQEAILLIMTIQVSVEGNLKALKDVSDDAKSNGRADVVEKLKIPLQEAEKNVTEIADMVQIILSSVPPAGTSAADVQGLMASYDEKVLVGLKMRSTRIEEHVKKVNTVVELARQAIGPS